MSKGRKSYGVKKKTKRDLIHFKKKIKAGTLKGVPFENGHPMDKKNLEDKLRKPRDYDK